ncbi:hypothetical protein AJ79_02009 [Helicocarpus griseus UAMH5409]|uniref:Glycosyl transferase CAP10 domain-containing protein n=1 Tax=Helicocarpus griseus UAMH5409 TaxID=1447875 RepID=A0A2B7Y4F6_9EURO|nr:hypothetical protein AJ79_02009 [Helicocarpus griseus UAMH5409]
MEAVARGTIKYAASTAFILSVSLLTLSADSSFVFDRPANTAVITFAFTGLSLLILGRFVSSPSQDSHVEDQDDSIQLSDSLLHTSTETSSRALAKLRKLTSAKIRKASFILFLAICALTLRIELFRSEVLSTECTTPALYIFIPLFLWVYDYWSNRRTNRINTAQGFDSNVKRSLTSTIPIILLIPSAFLTSSLSSAWKSTYICPWTGSTASRTVALQIFGVVLDTATLIAFAELARQPIRHNDGRRLQTTTLWGFILLGVSAVWFFVGCFRYVIKPREKQWLISLSPYYIRGVIKVALLFTCTIISASQLITQVGILGVSFLFSITFIYIIQLSQLWISLQAFPVVPVSNAVFAIILLHISGYWYIRSGTTTDPDRKKPSHPRWWLRLLFIALIIFSLGLLIAEQKEVTRHPIDILMSNAKDNHDKWAAKAKASKTLKEAVAEYQRRYSQHPPPGFDIWYEYATSRSSVVIDDYDQIYQDLLPFWALSPQSLRDLTNLMITDPWNDVAALNIRGGVAHIQEDIVPTHRWMIEGVAKMISPFAQHLPDMDVAFNLNDECRVAVPWEKINSLLNSAKSHQPPTNDKLRSSWSEFRASTWAPSDTAHRRSHRLFIDTSMKPTYDLIGRSVCPPSSKARTSFNWNQRNICLDCARPHSLEQFLQDWTLASDICHQPDLASLHGLYLSPAALKVSQSLLPVFSQSKVSGFNDILYPSAWNYIDKAVYSPSDQHLDLPLSQKDPTLFWRGTTSEGYSSNGEWKGMIRQRLLHLTNDRTSNPASILLPTSQPPTSNPTSYSYTIISASDIQPTLNLQTSVHVAERVVRCGKADCKVQTAEFQPGPSTDFQEHWRYRYLIDSDGAGFSGRFLPFLQSSSLPFRTGLFRQWMDDRLTPWYHFVPIDVRLHGLWSTLAYFAGARTGDVVATTGDGADNNKETDKQNDKDKDNSKPKSAKMRMMKRTTNNDDDKNKHNDAINDNNKKQILMEAHMSEGEFIAEEGRKWAEKALRKEDMEIYMFRLLLEWGRLTDDRREELGVRVP